MNPNTVTEALADPKIRRMLLADWFARLGSEHGLDFSNRGGGGSGSFTFGATPGDRVVAEQTDMPPYLHFRAANADQQSLIDGLVADAERRVSTGDLGGEVWYSSPLPEREMRVSGHGPMSDLLSRLASQTPIVGWRRLGVNILIEFGEVDDDRDTTSPPLFAKTAAVTAHIAVPAPCPGALASFQVTVILEVVAAIVAFALGRPVILPPGVFPSDEERLPELEHLHRDPEILNLARKTVSLDIFTPTVMAGAKEFFNRVRGALLTFDAARSQERDTVACALFVIAAECLTTPPTDWRKEKLTTRFLRFFETLMPASLDSIVQHDNFEEAFQITRGTRQARRLRSDFLSAAYDYRSLLVHSGLTPSYQPIGGGAPFILPLRRGLLSQFAEEAIISFLKTPLSSLVGHPVINPPAACQGHS
jgi:hypothetical protein